MNNSINNIIFYEFPWGKGELHFNFQDELVRVCFGIMNFPQLDCTQYISPNSVLFLKELDEYFSGKEIIFSVPINLGGCTEYQKKVYRCLSQSVTYGKTITYKQLSLLAGGSPRSIGQAMKRNPIAIVIPCHRVVGADGIGGFTGDLKIKQYLINLERRN